ncbi:MAG: TRAP transporter small permease [Dehalobacterium sp.]
MEKEQAKFFLWLDRFEKTAVTILLSAMTIVVFLQVFFRFVIKGSLPWSEELSRYLMIWAVFIGASMGAKVGAHIGVEAFISFFPKKVRMAAIILSGILSVLFCLVILVLSIKVVLAIKLSGQLSPAMAIPMYWAYLAVPVGVLLMGTRFIQATIGKFKKEGMAK